MQSSVRLRGSLRQSAALGAPIKSGKKEQGKKAVYSSKFETPKSSHETCK